ncbi:MAG: hypothetical protein PUD92_01350 [Clostridiales bacterium]|nr:hypothetical protein [Clostridiales bacterium]
MVIKIVLLAICALLLAVCYRAQSFAEKIMKKKEDEITDDLILRIKGVALVISVIVFVGTMIFFKN